MHVAVQGEFDDAMVASDHFENLCGARSSIREHRYMANILKEYTVHSLTTTGLTAVADGGFVPELCCR